MRTYPAGCFGVSADSAGVANAATCALSQTKASGLAPGKASAPTPELQRAGGREGICDRKKPQGRQWAPRPELQIFFPAQKWRWKMKRGTGI